MSTAYKIGAAAETDPTRIRTLRAAAGPTVDSYDTFRQGGTQYQVPVGKTLRITKLQFSGSVANVRFQIGYADTAANNTTSVPTNSVLVSSSFHSAVATTEYDLPTFIEIPAGKYPFLLVQSATATEYVTALGIES